MSAIMPTTLSTELSVHPRQRMNGSDRQQLILEAAIHLLSTGGFEGFRTRDVAQQAGITTATLHYYFPTKDALIEGVAEHLESLYAQEKAPPVIGRGREPLSLRAMRQEFADARFLRQHKPEMLAVSREFALRANRDDQIRALVNRLTTRWRTQLEGILRAGKDDGAIRPEIDPEVGAGVIVSAIWGATALLGMNDLEFEQLCDQLMRWLTTNARKERRTR